MYNRALSRKEIKELFDMGKPKPTFKERIVQWHERHPEMFLVYAGIALICIIAQYLTYLGWPTHVMAGFDLLACIAHIRNWRFYRKKITRDVFNRIKGDE